MEPTEGGGASDGVKEGGATGGVSEIQDGGDGALDESNKHSCWERNGGYNERNGGHNERNGGCNGIKDTVDVGEAKPWSRNHCRSSTKPSSSSSDSSSEVSLPTPPDGGWGWVVVLASFMVHLIADGCAFSFGVLYAELLDYFGESKGKTAWVGSLFVSVPLMTGPIASAFTNRYGCRKATIIGGVIAAVGFVLSSFANSIEHLCFTFGIISGFGLSLVYVAAVVIVAYYFETRRAFATGIAVAGSGIGTFVFAPLSEYLIEVYSWKGAVLIIGGIMLNICACGAVFRPIMDEEEAQRKRAQKRALDRNRMSKNTGSRSSELKELLTNPESRLKFNGFAPRRGESNPESSQENMKVPPSCADDLVVHSLLQFPTYLKNDINALPSEFVKAITSGKRTLHDILSDTALMEQCYATQSLSDVTCSVDVVHPSGQGDVTGELGCHGDDVTNRASTSTAGRPNGKLKTNHRDLLWQNQNNRARGMRMQQQQRTRYLYDRLRPMYRKDIFYRGSLMRTGENFPSGPRACASCPDIVMKTENDAASDSLTLHRMFPLSCISLSREVKNIMSEMLDTSILRSVLFVYFCLSSTLLYMWYDVPYVYTPDKAKDMGISEHRASYLVSILGIVSTVGQIGIGYVGDRPHISALHLYNFLTSTAGVATVLVPFLPTYLGLCIYAGTFGFFISGNYALTTIILVDLLGMEKLTNAYGLVMLAEGISNLIGPPVAGWIRDRTGNYDLTFYVAGSGIFLSGFMLIIIPLLYRCDSTARRTAALHAERARHHSNNSNHDNTSLLNPAEQQAVRPVGEEDVSPRVEREAVSSSSCFDVTCVKVSECESVV